MRNFIEFLVLHLVQHPEDVSVDEISNEGRIEYIIHVNDEDRGLVIGHGGRTINAIRTLVTVRAMKENVYIRVTLAEPNVDPMAAPLAEDSLEESAPEMAMPTDLDSENSAPLAE